MQISTPDITRMISAWERPDDAGWRIGPAGAIEASDMLGSSDVEGAAPARVARGEAAVKAAVEQKGYASAVVFASQSGGGRNR
jgi:hypothetical protein